MSRKRVALLFATLLTFGSVTACDRFRGESAQEGSVADAETLKEEAEKLEEEEQGVPPESVPPMLGTDPTSTAEPPPQ